MPSTLPCISPHVLFVFYKEILGREMMVSIFIYFSDSLVIKILLKINK
jgi:hypothetical protein